MELMGYLISPFESVDLTRVTAFTTISAKKSLSLAVKKASVTQVEYLTSANEVRTG